MMARTVVFRTDASLQIGSGHVMRCLTLAQSLAESGFDCQFVCRQHPGNLIEHIRGQGFTVHVLPAAKEQVDSAPYKPSGLPAHAGWLGGGRDIDAAATREVVAELDVEWLVVDHYALDRVWESQLRPHARAIMVIDDLADRPHDCDFLLDQNFGRAVDDYAGLVPEICTVLTGPGYALLRPRFAELRQYSLQRRQTPRLQRLLVSMGGVDQANATGMALDALRQCPLPETCTITVVMGPHAPWLQQVQAQANAMAQPCEVRVNVRDMAQLMADSDLAVGAAGSTSWERCALGLPTVMVVVADNQRQTAEHLHCYGAATAVTLAELDGSIRVAVGLMTSDAMSSQTSRAASLVDGHGVSRVITALTGGDR
jgi:UDP-2,4-diacetamido-2,4,6-trideoxy-beta-L-altropyranose hydrolase